MGISLTDKSLLKTGAYIDGQWVASDEGDTLAVADAGVVAGLVTHGGNG